MTGLGRILVFGLIIATALATEPSKRHRSKSSKRNQRKSKRYKQPEKQSQSTLTLPNRPKSPNGLIQVFPLGKDGKFSQRLDCTKDKASQFVTLADVLSHCVAQLHLQTVPATQWSFLYVEQESMVRECYSHSESAAVLANAVDDDGYSKIQLWQWKDVEFTVDYQRIKWKKPILPERFFLTKNSSLSVGSLWQLKFPDSIMEARDIDVFVYQTGRPDSRKPFDIDNSGGKLIFLLHAAYSLGEPLTLLLVEKEQECVISHEELLMDRQLVKKTRCNQRFLMSSWIQWPNACPVCRVEICDSCDERIERDIKKFSCGHAFHRDCNRIGRECLVCSSIPFVVILPSGEERFYQIENRRNSLEAQTTPAMVIRHLLEGQNEEVPTAFAVQLSTNVHPTPREISPNVELINALEGSELYTLYFEIGRNVTFRVIGHLGKLLETETRRITNEQETIRDHIALFPIEERVTVFKVEGIAVEVRNLETPVLKEIAGSNCSDFQFVTDSSIEFVVADRTHLCKIPINSVTYVKPIDMVQYCGKQLKISKNSREWTFSVKHLYREIENDVEIWGDEVYNARALEELRFKWRKAPPVIKGPNTAGLSKDGKTITVDVDITHSRAVMHQKTTCTVPADDNLTHNQLIAECLKSSPSLNDLSMRMLLNRPDGRRYNMRLSEYLVREWRSRPGFRLACDAVIPP